MGKVLNIPHTQDMLMTLILGRAPTTLRFKGFGNSNEPLSYGKVYTYAAGTQDALNAYIDLNGSEQSNPIILDARGEAKIYLDTTKAYKFRLYTATDSFVQEEDNIVVGEGGGIGGVDQYVKISNTDSVSGFLIEKLTAGEGINITTVVDALNGDHMVVNSDGKVKGSSSGDLFYLNDLILPGTGLQKSIDINGNAITIGLDNTTASSIGKVKLNSADTAGYLDVKLLAGSGMSISQVFDKLVINSIVPTPNIQLVGDTASMHLTVTGQTLSADVKISSTAGNGLSINPDGLYSSAPDLSGYIAKDGSTTTTAGIPFARGIKLLGGITAPQAPDYLQFGAAGLSDPYGIYTGYVSGRLVTRQNHSDGVTVAAQQDMSLNGWFWEINDLTPGLYTGSYGFSITGKDFLTIDSTGTHVTDRLDVATLAGNTHFTADNLGTKVENLYFYNRGTPAYAEGRMYYDFTGHSLCLMSEFSDVTQQIGEELFIRVRNTTGSIIPNGTVVYINGATGNKPTIALANNTDITMDDRLIGMTTHDIGINSVGIVTTYGIIHGVNTHGLTEGALIYLTTNGAWSTTQPASGFTVQIGIVNYAHVSNGEILLKTRSIPASESIGYVTKEYTGFDDPALVAVSYDSATRIVTVSGTAKLYQNGKLILDLAQGAHVSVAHANSDGTWYYYYDGGFIWSTTPWSFSTAQIFNTPFKSTHKFGVRDCHGLMDWRVHEETHDTIGTYRKSGGGLSGYVLASTTAADRRPAVAAAVIKDEDLLTTNPLLAAGSYTTLHLIGANGTPTFTLASADIQVLSGNNIQYNQFTGGAWQLTPVTTNNRYVNVWLLAIPVTADAASQAYRYVWVTGQTRHTTTTAALADTSSSLNLTSFTTGLAEYVFITRVTLRSTGTNWEINNVSDLTGSLISQGTSSTTGLSSVSTTDSATVTWTGVGTVASPLVATAGVGVYLPLAGGTMTGQLAMTSNVDILFGTPGGPGIGQYYSTAGGAMTWYNATGGATAATLTPAGAFSATGKIYSGVEVSSIGGVWSKASASNLIYAYGTNVGALIATGSSYARLLLEHTGATTGRRVWDLFTVSGGVYARWLSDDGATNNKDCFGIDSDGNFNASNLLTAASAVWSKASASSLTAAYGANVGALIATGSGSSRMVLEHTVAATGRRVFDQINVSGSVFWRWLSDDASALTKECFAIDTNGTMLLANNLQIGSIPTGTQTYLLGQDSAGQVIRGTVPVSATAGNAVTLNSDGVYVPTPAVATTSVYQLDSFPRALGTTLTMPGTFMLYAYRDVMPAGGTFGNFEVISVNGLGGSGTGIRGFLGKVTATAAGNFTVEVVSRTANYATNSQGKVTIALDTAQTLLQGQEYALILRVDKSSSGDLLAVTPSAGVAGGNFISAGENSSGSDPAVGASITFYSGTLAMLPWMRVKT